jgi:hypothetical protein
VPGRSRQRNDLLVSLEQRRELAAAEAVSVVRATQEVCRQRRPGRTETLGVWASTQKAVHAISFYLATQQSEDKLCMTNCGTLQPEFAGLLNLRNTPATGVDLPEDIYGVAGAVEVPLLARCASEPASIDRQTLGQTASEVQLHRVLWVIKSLRAMVLHVFLAPVAALAFLLAGIDGPYPLATDMIQAMRAHPTQDHLSRETHAAARS